uniref:Protein REVEILLE 5 n=1 Tax=Noccaea caerulescens TaxID=107243 RepID=A0A1J3HA59_NOCCA
MVSVNPRPGPAQGFPFFDPVDMSLPGIDSAAPCSDGFGVNPIATMPVTGQSNTSSFSEDLTTKIRKPYTIKKSRESWTEQEHDKFIEALHLFDRDWKKIEAFVGSKTVVQIRSHAQKYFLKVQKSGAKEHLPPPRPKRKATHPYPQKAPKNVALTSLPASNAPLLEPGYLHSSDSQSFLGNQAVCASSSSSWSHDSSNPPKPVSEGEEPGVSTVALRCYSTSSKEVTRRLPAVTETSDEESCEKPHRVMPNFAEVYSFIGSVFDPNTSGHLRRLKQMDPINMETVLILMRNLSVNLTSPKFAEQRKLISSYSTKALK